MKFSLHTSVLVGTVAALAIFAGCGQKSSTDTASGTTGSTTTSGSKIAVAFVTNNASDYWTLARKGTEAAQKELPDVDVQFKIPADGTAAEQKQIIDDLLAKGVTGFAISPVDPTNQTQMLDDAAKKATVITQDSDAPNSDRVCYIGTDNVAAGVMAGDLMKKALPNGGKIMLFVGKKDAQNAKDRADGIKKALTGSNIQIIDTRTDETDRARAQQNVEDALVKYPDLAGCMGLWSYNGPAILRAVTRENKIGKVKIVCFDEEPDTLIGVKSGAIYSTIVQQPYEFGKKAVEMLAAIAKGDKSMIPANKLDIIPTLAINATNVDAYKIKIAKMRAQ